ncbi:MAG: hypothetical protein IPG99_12860 [Ignavibacteria bacterium]|nr:hypothetical protein [Ignavibacteria bacterium]
MVQKEAVDQLPNPVDEDDLKTRIIMNLERNIDKKMLLFIKNRLRNKMLSLIDRNTRVSSKYTDVTDSIYSYLGNRASQNLLTGLICSKYLRKIT